MDVSPRSLSPSVALACAALAGVPAPGAAQQSDARTALGTLYESTWEAILRLDPEFASEVGDLRFQRQWTDRSPDATNRLRDRLRAALDSLGAIDREELDARGRVDYDVLEDFARTVASAPAAEHVSVLSSYGYTPISQMGGVHQSIASTLNAMPRRSVSDYEDIVARLAGVAAPIDGAIEALRGEGRSLRPYEVPDLEEVEKWLADNQVLDPEGAEDVFEAMSNGGLLRGLRQRLRTCAGRIKGRLMPG
jgi:uncharacterized protein (DUF885 family)